MEILIIALVLCITAGVGFIGGFVFGICKAESEEEVWAEYKY